MGHCKDCKFWGVDYDGDCDRVGYHENGPVMFDYYVNANDDSGLEFRLLTGPDFGCVHFEKKR